MTSLCLLVSTLYFVLQVIPTTVQWYNKSEKEKEKEKEKRGEEKRDKKGSEFKGKKRLPLTKSLERSKEQRKRDFTEMVKYQDLFLSGKK